MDELLAIVGRLYIDLFQAQKIITELQKQLSAREDEISEIQKSIISKQIDK
jgi:hypothetical protein